jgi:hypothetical protein
VTAQDLDFSTPVRGLAYGPAFRALATLIVVVVLASAVRAHLTLPDEALAQQGWGPLLIGLAALAGSYYLLMTSTTTIDAQGIRQSGLLEKKVVWAQVEAARLGGFAFSRRLIVRAGSLRPKVFFGGTPELVAAFQRIAAAYPYR